MNTTFINLNNVWTEILIISSDTEQSFSNIVEDGDKRYYVTPYRDFIEDGKHYYWFIINSKEIVNMELKQQMAELSTENNALGQQVAALTLSSGQKDTVIQQLGAQAVQMQLDIAALKGGVA